jgi:hypothetical protein
LVNGRFQAVDLFADFPEQVLLQVAGQRASGGYERNNAAHSDKGAQHVLNKRLKSF